MKTSSLFLVLATVSASLTASAQTPDAAGSSLIGACCTAQKSCCLAPLAAADEPSAADAAAIAKARASYPLKTCLVADEAFTSIDKAVGHVHRVAGQPDRVIFVCCNDCVADFKAAPANYLAKLDAAKKK
jgi:hypothetical protein